MPVLSKTPIIVPAIVMPTFPEAVARPPEIASNEPERETELHDPEVAETQAPQTSDEPLDIVVGESLLEITGEYPKVGWETLQPSEESEVEPVTDWSSRAQELDDPPASPDEKDALEITSEGGLDWDSWEFGRNTSDFAAQGEGFVINRHELSPEASEMGASHNTFDGHEPAANDAVAEIDEAAMGDHPEVEFTAVAETVAREEEPHPPVLSLPSISEFQMTTEREETVSSDELEALKEGEPWPVPVMTNERAGATAHAPQEAADALERIAQRLRRGEIALPSGAATGTDELALAAVLAAIIRTPEQ
ncbi:MAG TPA: hypothetical protein VJ672_13175 [Gemmatimonadaceae bacterium]|nr:hypothetical protein [Gemmatimonadaceae bacterium]